MRLSNFRMIKTVGKDPTNIRYFAEVTVHTGFWMWKQVYVQTIYREFSGYWFFRDTGKFTPGTQAEELERAWNCQQAEKLLALGEPNGR